jgi:hypothetical protein
MFLRLPLQKVCETSDLESDLEKIVSANILRWGGVGFNKGTQEVLIEVVTSPLPIKTLAKGKVTLMSTARLGIMVVPTGLGCRIGGFGGDANLCANLLSSEFDYLIVNPNVTNGGAWQNLSSNMLYVEGFALDLFMKGLLALRPVKANKIGVVFDKALSESLIKKELEVVKAAQTIWGLDYLGFEITDEPLQPIITISENACSSGSVENIQVLIQSAQSLKAKGAEAIALVTQLPSVDDSSDIQYSAGAGPDPIGGLEAIYSHSVTSQLLLPCAHAPSFNEDFNPQAFFDERVSPEVSSFSFLPSVLKGLQKAPKLISLPELRLGDLVKDNVEAFIGPKDCWLGSSFLSAAQAENCLSYAVQSNEINLQLTPALLGLQNVQIVSNYLELLGHLKAAKLGLKLRYF